MAETNKPALPIEDEESDENVSLAREFIWFVRENKKWWLIPLVSVFIMLAGVILLSAHPAAIPFLYSFF